LIKPISSKDIPMKVAIIGAGNVGGTLGTGWARAGHEVIYGVRNAADSKVQALLDAARGKARSASNAEAVAAAEIVVLATPWEVTEEAVKSCGSLAGKTVIDVTNPLKPGLAGLTHGLTTSGAEMIAEWAKGAKVVKCFNTAGYNVMANPNFDGVKAVMFYCGDDVAAKQATHQLAANLGFDPKDAGPLTQARYLEPFAMLWISMAVFHGYGRDFAFQFIQR
jgi:predicted dinucleotide-binding enzyme